MIVNYLGRTRQKQGFGRRCRLKRGKEVWTCNYLGERTVMVNYAEGRVMLESQKKSSSFMQLHNTKIWFLPISVWERQRTYFSGLTYMYMQNYVYNFKIYLNFCHPVHFPTKIFQILWKLNSNFRDKCTVSKLGH